MKKERVRSKHGFKGLGKFFLGWTLGFISTFLVIFGIGYWAYTSLTLRKIEKWTKSDITNNEGLEKLTIKKTVAIMQGLASTSSDAYTLAKLEEDFGVNLPDTLGDTGITLDIIKNSSFKNFEQAIEDTIDTITFNNILKFLGTEESADLGVIDTILEKETTYYIHNGKLYTNVEHTIEVDFEYTINGSTVKLDTGVQNTIASNQVKFTLSDLPLNSALTSMTSTTKKLQIYELLDYHYDSVSDRYYQEYADGAYLNPVSGVMDAIAGYTIDELADQEKINELKIHEVMGYYKNEVDGNYYTSDTFSEETKVASVMNSLADKTIGDLSKDETFNNLYIHELMGYYYNTSDECYYTKSDFSAGSKVDGIMKTIAGKTIGQLDDDGVFDDVLLADALGYTISGNEVYDGETKVTGVIKQLVLKGTVVSKIASDVQGLTIDQILDIDPNDEKTSSVIKALSDKKTTIKTLNGDINELTLIEILGGNPDNSPIIEALKTSTIKSLSKDINDLTLGDALGKSYDETTGVLKTFYNTKVKDLANEIKDIAIWQAMGYYEKNDGGVKSYYLNYNSSTEEYSNPVTGIMASLAGKTVSELSDSNTFKGLYIYDIMGYYYNESNSTYYKTSNDLSDENRVTGIMGMLQGVQLGNIEEKIDNIINKTNVYTLIKNGVITLTLDEVEDASTIAFLSTHTVPSLLKFINDNIDALMLLVP